MTEIKNNRWFLALYAEVVPPGLITVIHILVPCGAADVPAS